MKRPILIALIGYIVGIIWELYLKTSIAPFIITLIIVFAIYCKGMVHCTPKNEDKRNNTKIILIVISSMIISSTLTSYLNRKYEIIYKKISTEEQTYIGTIISDAKKGEYKTSYTIKIESINGDIKYKDIKLIVNIPNKENIKLEYGNKIKFIGNYNAPEVQRNYKGFDYSEYLKTLKIYGTITYSEGEIKTLKIQNINTVKLITHKISKKIENNIKEILKQKEGGLLIGILLGNNENIDEEIKEDFRNSGIYHILAVSGAHMSYVILGITYLLDKISISRRKKETIKMLGIIFFMLITNTSISVTRAGIMGIITLGASFFYKRKDTINSVCLSMIIILIYNPYSIKSISFQLSYGGVIGILLLNKPYIRLLKNIKLNKKNIVSTQREVKLIKLEAISTILSAQTMIIPIMIINFHTISLTFLFANILVSYLIGAVIILGFICAFLSLISLDIAGFIAIFLNQLLKLLIFIAKFFGDLPLSKIYIATPHMLSILLYYITICWQSGVMSSPSPVKSVKQVKFAIGNFSHITSHFSCLISHILPLILIITIILSNYIFIPTELKIHFIDVGQGDSTLIITPNNKKILIDGGGTMNSSENYDIGKDTLVPYLLNRGVKKIDYIMISHFDADHCQGLIAVLDSLKVKNIIISKQAEKVYNYEKIMEIAVKKKINLMVVKRGDIINVDNNVEIKIIYPESKLYFDDINSNSIVAKLTYNKFIMLFTGDIESKAEERIVNIAQNELKSTILKVAHHGSKTSSTEELLKAVKPQIALIGVGKDNKFGHPNEEIIKRIESYGTKIYRTDEHGEITIRINEEGRIWLNKMLN